MAGEIRQEEVLAELFRLYKIDPKEKSNTRLPNNDLISTFQKQTPKFISILDKEEAKVLSEFKEISHSSLKRYLGLKKAQLEKSLYPGFKELKLHKVRKTIKEILFLSPIASKSKKHLNPFFNRLQVRIGQWHDKKIVLQMIGPVQNAVGRNQLKAACKNDIKDIKILVAQFYR
jgi:CHAD domain-containing protein